ncbi:MAG: cadmium-translocating P-type ATPase [Alphaproteobacteria bacterium]|nr:cadmium-translocating P-type ATPase [Alphaproteobacteria bacterium]
MSGEARELRLVAAPAAGASACLHCGTALPEGADGDYCCAGCEAAARVIREAGLSDYYRRRVLDPETPAPRSQAAPGIDLSRHVRAIGEGRHGIELVVDGLHCAACVWLIETLLRRDPRVRLARLNVSTRRLSIAWDGAAELARELVGRVTLLGYRAVPYTADNAARLEEREERALLRALAVAGFAAGNVMLLSIAVWSGHDGEMGQATRDLLHWVSALIALPALAYAGQPFFRSALQALRAGRTNMDVPVSIGVLLAAAISLSEVARSGPHAYFDSAITLVFFLLLGRYLERRARGRARSAARHLLALSGGIASRIGADGAAEPVDPVELRPGDRLMVAAGERIAADGTVLAGRSSVDASLVTGESLPQPVAPGTRTFAGMVNLSGPIELRVDAAGSGTLLAEIVRLLEAAEQGNARHVALADRVARAYAPVVHVLALLTFAGWLAAGAGLHTAVLVAATVLIITCPCALALAVPAVQVVVSGALYRRGILLKSPTALERLAEVDTVVFDKTGTLTLGRPELIASEDWSREDLELGAALAANSRHPLSRALHRAAPHVAPASGIVEHPGEGLAWTGPAGTVRLGSRRFCGIDEPGDDGALEIWLARPDRAAPVRFTFVDPVRPDARETLAELGRRGYRIALLSGDREPAVRAVAAALGIKAWQAGLTPADKCRLLDDLARAGRRTLMAGDGLNDAPALAAGHASISPASAADVTQTAADAIFQGDRLRPVVEILDLARRAQRLVWQNLALALAYNAIAIPLAVLGHVTPLIAAIAMSGSSLLVIANAMRGGRSVPS